MSNPVLGIWGGADGATSAEAIAEFDGALAASGVEHRFVTYEGAPNSFFRQEGRPVRRRQQGRLE